MTSVQTKDLKGKAVGEVAFDESIFNVEPNIHVMHQALHRQLTNGRAGTASTLTRAEVRGGGRKPWRQKGTGRARAGSIRSPLWNGGGVIFGPKPRDFSQSMNKKARQLALRSALSARREQFIVVQNFDGLFKNPPTSSTADKAVEQPKTKQFLAVLTELGLAANRKVLILLDSGVPGYAQIERAARNLPTVRILNINNLNVKDLIESDAVLSTERTVVAINNRFKAIEAETTNKPKPVSRKAAPASAESAPAKKAAAPKKASGAETTAADKPKATKAKAEPAAEKAPKAKKKD